MSDLLAVNQRRPWPDRIRLSGIVISSVAVLQSFLLSQGFSGTIGGPGEPEFPVLVVWLGTFTVLWWRYERPWDVFWNGGKLLAFLAAAEFIRFPLAVSVTLLVLAARDIVS